MTGMKNKAFTMNQKWYKSDIIERFMTQMEMVEFDRKYHNSKLVEIGRDQIDGHDCRLSPEDGCPICDKYYGDK